MKHYKPKSSLRTKNDRIRLGQFSLAGLEELYETTQRNRDKSKIRTRILALKKKNK
tara:strand:- start:1157 stop:1324 length:168 start_codon:yes stop_codon:yes gene_type:complete